ncbi:PAS domain-containing protein [Methanosarcina horonobensis]
MAHIGSWKWDIITGELYWSDEIYRIFGLNPQESKATYNAFFNYIHPNDRDFVDTTIKKKLCMESSPMTLTIGLSQLMEKSA